MATFADRYGIPPGQNRGTLFGPGTTGLTPLTPLYPDLTADEQDRRDNVQAYQRGLLRGYTTRLLIDLDCITSRDLRPQDLNNPIWDMFHLKQWESRANSSPYITRAPYTFDGKYIEQPGTIVEWFADQPEVWAALEPCLRLASKILENLQDHPWLNTILFAEWEPVPQDRFKAQDFNGFTKDQREYKYTIVRPRENEAANADQVRARVKELRKNVLDLGFHIGISSNQVDPFTGAVGIGLGSKCSGVTATMPGSKVTHMFIAYESITPLLGKNNVNSSERLAGITLIAKTIVHETIHVLMLQNFAQLKYSARFDSLQRMYPGVRRAPDDMLAATTSEIDLQDPEPYFMDEIESECGASGEQALFGGTIRALNFKTGTTALDPSLGLFLEPFPIPLRPQGMNPIILNHVEGTDPEALTSNAIPLPIIFAENLNSQNYWDGHVTKFGIVSALHSPKPFSFIYTYDTSPRSRQRTCWPVLTKRDADFEVKFDRRSINSLLELSPDERDLHADTMRIEVADTYTDLTVQRDELVRTVQEELQYWEDSPIASKEQLTSGYLHIITKLQELARTHLSILPIIVLMERRQGADNQDARIATNVFHRRLRRYVGEFMEALLQYMDCSSLQAILDELDALSISTTYIDPHVLPPPPLPPPGQGPPGPAAVFTPAPTSGPVPAPAPAAPPQAQLTQAQLDDAANMTLLQQAIVALENGNIRQSYDHCQSLIYSLGTRPYIQAMAHGLVGLPQVVLSTRARMTELQRAANMFPSIVDSTVPAVLRWTDFKARVIRELTDLRARFRRR